MARVDLMEHGGGTASYSDDAGLLIQLLSDIYRKLTRHCASSPIGRPSVSSRERLQSYLLAFLPNYPKPTMCSGAGPDQHDPFQFDAARA